MDVATWKTMGFAACAIAVGVVSAWPLESSTAVLRAGVQGGAFFGLLMVFFGVLPGRMTMPSQVFVAMISGSVAGWLAIQLDAAPFVSDYLGILGTLFLLLLKVVIIPLVFVSVLCGVAGVGDARKLSALGTKTMAFFLFSTTVAVLMGIALVQWIEPGVGRETLQAMAQDGSTPTSPANIGQRIQRDILPSFIQNPIMAGQSPMVVIFMALLIGAALASIGPKGEAALAVFRSLDAAFIVIIQWVMLLAPIGVFALLARVIAELGVGYILTLAQYCGTVLLGLTLHFIFLCCVVVPLLARMHPLRFLAAMAPAFQLAFSTSSSNATLPVTMDCAVNRAGANPNVAGFVIPLGATVNMDGTAIYVAVASIFIGQVYGIDLSLQQEVVVFLMAVLVSIATAGIPGASVGLISTILTAVGIPIEGLAIVVGADRLLDMSRTVLNITGDAVGALILSRGMNASSLRTEESV